MTNSEYHAHASISKSGLDLINKSPHHYKYAKDNPQPPTPAMLFGSLVHSIVFGFEDYLIIPDIDKRKKESKEIMAEFEELAKNPKYEFQVTQSQFDEAKRISESVMAHPTASVLLKKGYAEKPIFTKMHGIDVKCKTDWINDQHNIIVDLKTTTDASPQAFAKSCVNYRYHVQAAFYTDVLATAGIEIQGFVFIAVEKTPPYAVAVYELGEDEIRLGRTQYLQDLETYRQCIESNEYPAYSNKILKLNFPSWAFNL